IAAASLEPAAVSVWLEHTLRIEELAGEVREKARASTQAAGPNLVQKPYPKLLRPGKRPGREGAPAGLFQVIPGGLLQSRLSDAFQPVHCHEAFTSGRSNCNSGRTERRGGRGLSRWRSRVDYRAGSERVAHLYRLGRVAGSCRVQHGYRSGRGVHPGPLESLGR